MSIRGQSGRQGPELLRQGPNILRQGPELFAILAGKVWKLEANGGPKILKIRKNPSKVLPKIVSGQVLYATSEKVRKKCDFRLP